MGWLNMSRALGWIQKDLSCFGEATKVEALSLS